MLHILTTSRYLQQDIWKLLLNCPMRIPIELVNKALSLKPATPDNKPALEVSKVELLLDRPVKEFTPEELMAALLDPSPISTNVRSFVHSYYIRSFQIQMGYLQIVPDDLVADGFWYTGAIGYLARNTRGRAPLKLCHSPVLWTD
jgi:hypothetical protein